MSMRDILLALALTWCLWNSWNMHHNYKQDKRSNLIDKMTLQVLKIHCHRLDVLEHASGIKHTESTFMDPETLDLCEDLIMFADKKFCSECYPEDKDFSVNDLVDKYGLKNILINYMDYVRKKG